MLATTRTISEFATQTTQRRYSMQPPVLSKKERAIVNDMRRWNEWKSASWFRKIIIILSGNSPVGRNHRADWHGAGGPNYHEWKERNSKRPSPPSNE